MFVLTRVQLHWNKADKISRHPAMQCFALQQHAYFNVLAIMFSYVNK